MSQHLPRLSQFSYQYSVLADDAYSIEKEFHKKAAELTAKFNIEIDALNEEFKKLVEIRGNRILQLRDSMIFSYFLYSEEINGETHYWIERTGMNIDAEPHEQEYFAVKQLTDKVVFIGFKIVNNVYIISRKVGGNHIIFENGLPLTDDEVALIKNGEIPERLLTTKAVF